MLILKKKNIYYITYYGEMMMTFTNLKSLCLAITMLAILPLSDVFSQDFIMETAGATYNATANGVIRMKGAASSFENTGALNALGTTSGDAIEGIVDWASTVAQDVQGLYYTNMVISGGVNKNILTGVYITGLVNATPPSGYADFATYPFYIEATQVGFTNTFAGTFNYIGTTQNIFPATGNDAYVNLAMDNATGAYTMPTTTVTSVTGTIALSGTSTLLVNGELYTALESSLAGDVTIAGLIGEGNAAEIQIGEEAITFAGDLDVTDYSTLNAGAGGIITTGATLIDGTSALVSVEAGDVEFNGNIDVTEGSVTSDVVGDGSVTVGTGATLALTATAGELNFGPATDLFITGAMSNAGDGTNLNFEATSTVTYNSGDAGQVIIPTLPDVGNSYGNLVLSGGSKVGGDVSYDDNINIATNFSLADGNLDMVTNSGYLNMLSEDGTVTYADLEEVVGSFRREFTTAAAGPYTFNNAETELTFTGAPDAAGYYQLNVQGGVSPLTYVEATDVNRKIVPTYAAALGDVEYTIQAAYLFAENPTFAPNPDLLSLDNLKFFEADATPASEKLAGSNYGRANAVDGVSFGTLSLAGIIDGTGAVDGTIEKEFTSGHDLVLRASNTMFSIVDGRWSNPNVWDEGRTPEAEDNVEVRTVVYVGIDGPFAGTSGGDDDVATSNTKDEFEIYGTDPAANKITIANLANSSLIIGNEDNGATYVHKTAFNGTSFLNKNTNAIAVAFPMPAKGSVLSNAGLNGLWLNGYGAGDPVVLRTMALQNEGAVNNEGIIEIGE